MSYKRSEVIETSRNYYNGDELAADVVTKYFLRDHEGEFLEESPDQMHRRLAKEFARAESKYPNPMSEEEIYLLFKDFGEVIPQGSPMSAIGNPYQLQSLSNCFVIDQPDDSYGGILFTDQEQVQIMKRRGGVGFDISKIRPKGVPTSNAARTTDGIGIFMDRFSNSCREVAQGGRRGALMLTIDCRHPEIETFINIKRDRTRVTGANISIRFTDEFMKAAEANEEFTLRWPVDAPVESAQITKVVNAKQIWDQFVDGAWDSAEPGALFWDRVKQNTPADIYTDEGFESISTNPCIVGSTLIATADGRNAVSIKQLAEEGRDVPVYSTNTTTGQVEIKYGRNPRLTKNNVEVWKLTLDDGSSLIATPDHKILKKDCSYVNLSDLKSGDSIFSFNTFNSNGYRQVSNNHKVVSVEKFGIDDVYNITVDDNHNYHVITSYDDEKFVVSSGICVKNCGEIVLCPYDSCRLMVLNLSTFVIDPFTENASFDFERFRTSAIKAQRLMDDLIDLEIEAVDKIRDKIANDPQTQDIKQIEIDLWEKIRAKALLGRRTGLGITALGDTLAMLGLRYGSDESVTATENIYRTLAVGAHTSSCIMAAERGSFPVFNYEKEKNHEYLDRILTACGPEIYNMWKTSGRRNIALTTTAPTGSVSMLTQTTSGIEPAFLLSYKRRKKLYPSDTRSADFVDQMGDRWQEYTVYHHNFKKWMEVTGKTAVEDSPYWKATSNDVDWIKSVEIQAAAQKWIDHSLSKTCNLPNDATKETISDVYMAAWKSGCKGFTVYRDGCRTGVLVQDTKEEKKESDGHSAVKRGKDLPCEIHRVNIKGEGWLVLVGLKDGNPYEIFCGVAENIEVPRKVKHGTIVKNGKKDGVATYNLVVPFGDDDEIIFKDVVNLFANPTQGAFTRTISLTLRHGIPLHFIVEQLQKGKNDDMFSFSRVLARVLKSYIPDGTKTSGKTCPECGSDALIYMEGCMTCSSCGSSKCS